ncbi:MAG: uracil-DNA glycosylase [Candidatus Thermoplasmatota archaeon]|nr:uracil-DNA glycosylase [Candidatus Thermoplasmatota archaeon]MBU1940559.1 uracil-DNA glycosylase [Candidatus Thermoplasmatota archaeon]
MQQLAKKIQQCCSCELSSTRTHIVVGTGIIPSTLMFIGEAPGKNEDQQGIPFVGRAGKIFDQLLNSIQLHRNNVYITNILKCRPPKNRNPTIHEITRCSTWIDQQLKIIQPQVIAPMGSFATHYCCSKFNITFTTIGSMHGIPMKITHRKFTGTLYPLYHPAATIYNNQLKHTLFDDFKKLNKILSTIL